MKKNYLILLVIALSIVSMDSIFAHGKSTSEPTLTTNPIQRVKLDFVTPMGYTRHLLLGFTPDNAASDGVDYGYDALNIENWPDDLNWRIGDNNYIIQGVGEFSLTKVYPFRMLISNSGTVEFVLNSLENFNSPIDVFIYDSQLGTFSQLNSNSFSIDMPTGENINRFYITFTNQYNMISTSIQSFMAQQLSVDENFLDKPSISYYYTSHEIKVSSQSNINQLLICDLSGKLLYMDKPKNNNNITIDLNSVYIDSPILVVQVFTERGRANRKIILGNKPL